jgi:hypothetical protein
MEKKKKILESKINYLEAKSKTFNIRYLNKDIANLRRVNILELTKEAEWLSTHDQHMCNKGR